MIKNLRMKRTSPQPSELGLKTYLHFAEPATRGALAKKNKETKTIWCKITAWNRKRLKLNYKVLITLIEKQKENRVMSPLPRVAPAAATA